MPTTIQIKEETLKRLQEQKITSRQSYDEVLNRILDEVEDETLTEEEFQDILVGLEQVKQGKTTSIESLAEKYNIQL